MNKLSSDQIAWLAGIYEGEGCCYYTGLSSITVVVAMTDGDIVKRLHELTGVGSFSGPKSNGPGRKDKFLWSVGAVGAVDFLTEVLDWLGERRHQRAVEAIERWRGSGRMHRSDTHCTHGHEMTAENTYWEQRPNGSSRRCRKCTTERMARHRAEKRQGTLLPQRSQ